MRERVIVVNLPIPAWHQAATIYDAKYRSRLETLVKKFKRRDSFAFVNMPDLNGNDDYYDEAHPKPRLARQWAERVGQAIGSLACISGPATSAKAGEILHD